MPDEKIRVTFKRVYVRRDGDWCGSGEWYFIASVDGVSVGDRNSVFNARENTDIYLSAAEWHREVNVRNKTEVVVSFQVMDKDIFRDDDMGTIRHRLRRPYAQGSVVKVESSRNFDLEIQVELQVEGSWGPHAGNMVFATRRNAGSGTVTYDTVSGNRASSRMEICPIWPTPPDANMPTRPAVPAGTTVVRNGTAVNIAPGSNINIIPNPAVIPVLSAPAAGPAPPTLPAGAPPRATPQNAARIEYTYYWPDTLNFTDNDRRLEWEIAPAGNATTLGGSRGRRITVYGTNEGNVLLRMRFEDSLFAVYSATVKEIKQIPFRANILNGPNVASTPRATPQDVQNHIAVANRFLRQVGLELVPDSDATRMDNARATGQPSIFRIRVGANLTRNVHGNYPRSSVLNSRPNVLNIQYIHSLQAPAGWVIFGRATDFAANGSGNQIQDNQAPTPSWYRPAGGGCGVPPDPAPGGAVSMNLLAAHQRNNPPNRFAFLITDANGDPSTAAGHMTYGNVIAHELGHVLNLRHRRGAGPDGLGHPPQQNIMCQGEPATIRQDFDRLQAEAMHDSPLVP